jgi:hypothetical protein
VRSGSLLAITQVELGINAHGDGRRGFDRGKIFLHLAGLAFQQSNQALTTLLTHRSKLLHKLRHHLVGHILNGFATVKGTGASDLHLLHQKAREFDLLRYRFHRCAQLIEPICALASMLKLIKQTFYRYLGFFCGNSLHLRDSG